MSRKYENRHHDTNALVLGNGVSFAVLESMFNLVQTQSLLSASMVKSQDLSHIQAIDTLARAMSEVMSSNACRAGASNSKSPSGDTGSKSYAVGPGGMGDILNGGPGQGGGQSNASEIELLHELIEMLNGIAKELTEVVRDGSNGKLMVY